MAYSEYQKERIERVLTKKGKTFEVKKMMGGICFLIDDKLCVGLDIDKTTKKDRLMARIGEDAMTKALSMTGCTRMDFTGKPMKGYVFIDAEGFDLDEDLEQWINWALEFNPLAKSSKKIKINPDFPSVLICWFV